MDCDIEVRGMMRSKFICIGMHECTSSMLSIYISASVVKEVFYDVCVMWCLSSSVE